jgi:hypothetical protein
MKLNSLLIILLFALVLSPVGFAIFDPAEYSTEGQDDPNIGRFELISYEDKANELEITMLNTATGAIYLKTLTMDANGEPENSLIRFTLFNTPEVWVLDTWVGIADLASDSENM